METQREQPPQTESDATDEAPPFGENWTTLYAVVLANLAVLIVLFYLFTRAFS